jgi:hypothetical protein
MKAKGKSILGSAIGTVAKGLRVMDYFVEM